jgi:hypothetical protein
VIRAHAAEVLELPTDAPGVLADIDTPQLYTEWLGTGPAPAAPAPEP